MIESLHESLLELFHKAAEAITVPIEGIKLVLETGWKAFEAVAPETADLIGPYLPEANNPLIYVAGAAATLSLMVNSKIRRRQSGDDAISDVSSLKDIIYNRLPKGSPLKIYLDERSKFMRSENGKGFEVRYLGHNEETGRPIMVHYNPATATFWSVVKNKDDEYLALRSDSDLAFRQVFGLALPDKLTQPISPIVVSSIGDSSNWPQGLDREIDFYAEQFAVQEIAKSVIVPQKDENGITTFRSTDYALTITPQNENGITQYVVQPYFRISPKEHQATDQLLNIKRAAKGRPAIFSNSESAEKATRALVLYMKNEEEAGVSLATRQQRIGAMLSNITQNVEAIAGAALGEMPHAESWFERLDFAGELISSIESIFINARRNGLNRILEPLVNHLAGPKTRLPFTRIKNSFISDISKPGTENGMPVPIGKDAAIHQALSTGTLFPVDPSMRERTNEPDAELDTWDLRMIDASDPNDPSRELFELINKLQTRPAGCAIQCTNDKIICETPDGVRIIINGVSGDVTVDPTGLDIRPLMPQEFMGGESFNLISEKMAKLLNKDLFIILANTLNDQWIQGCRANTSDQRGTKRQLKGPLSQETLATAEGMDADWLKAKLAQYGENKIPGVTYALVTNRDGTQSQTPYYQIDLGDPAVRIGDGTMPPSWEQSNLRQAAACVASRNMTLEAAAQLEHESWLGDLIRSQGVEAAKNNPHAKAWHELESGKQQEIMASTQNARNLLNKLIEDGNGPRKITVTLGGQVLFTSSNGQSLTHPFVAPNVVSLDDRRKLREQRATIKLTSDELAANWDQLPKAQSLGTPRDLFIAPTNFPYLSAGKGDNREVMHTNIPAGTPIAFMGLDASKVSTLEELVAKLKDADIYPYGASGDFKDVAPTDQAIVDKLMQNVRANNAINNDCNPQTALDLLKNLTSAGLGQEKYDKLVTELAETMCTFKDLKGQLVGTEAQRRIWVASILSGLPTAERYTRLDKPVAVLTLTQNALITNPDGAEWNATTDKVVVLTQSIDAQTGKTRYDIKLVDQTVFDSRYRIGDGSIKAATLRPTDPKDLITATDRGALKAAGNQAALKAG